MAFVYILGRNYLKELSVLVYLVVVFCSCHVSCVLVNVTRREQDIFSYPGISSSQCYLFCQRKKSFENNYLTSQGICICQCSYDFRTFVTAKSKCVADKNVRNAEKGNLKFLLYDNENVQSHLYIIPFDSNTTTILFEVPTLDKEVQKCNLNDFEVLNDSVISHGNVLEWNSVKGDVKYAFSELDDDEIELDYPWIHKRYEGWIMLTANWTINPNTFTGRIMRLNVTCTGLKKIAKRNLVVVTGVMVFKVNGTLRLSDRSFKTSTMAPIMSTTHHLIPSPSLKSILSTYSNTTVVASTKLISMTSSSLKLLTSPSFIPTISVTSSYSKSSKFETTKLTSTLSSIALSSSSAAVAGPPNASKSSNTAVVTGIVVAGVILLFLGLALLVYTLRKRGMILKRRTHSDLGHLNPNHPSLSSLATIPALNNPLNDGIYVNPEVFEDERDRRSGITSVDSAAYDACIIVENPSADREAKSVYDNVPADPPENIYKALDPAKREPSVKYESLIKPTDHEYSTIPDSVSGNPMREPLYSEIDELPPAVQTRNAHGPTPPALEPRKSEPIYNVLEDSREVLTSEKSTTPMHPPLATRNPLPSQRPLSHQEPLPPVVTEKSGYNQLGNSDNKTKEESTEADCENGPVYSVLENSGNMAGLDH